MDETVKLNITKHKKVSNAKFSLLLLNDWHEKGKFHHKMSGKIDDYGDPIAVVETLMEHAKTTQFGGMFFAPADGVFPYFAVPAQGSISASRFQLRDLVNEANLNLAGDFSSTSSCQIVILKLEDFSSTGSLSLAAYLTEAYMDYPFTYCKSESDEHVATIAVDNQRVADRIASLTKDGKQETKECVCLQIFQHCNRKMIAQLPEERGVALFPWASYFQGNGCRLEDLGLPPSQKTVLWSCIPSFLPLDISGLTSSTTIEVGSPPVLDLNEAILVLCRVGHEVFLKNTTFEDQGAAHTLLHDAICRAASNQKFKAPLLGPFVIGQCSFATTSAIVQVGAHFVTYIFDETFTRWEYVNDINHRPRKTTAFTSTASIEGRICMIFARRVANPSSTREEVAKAADNRTKYGVAKEGISLLC